MGEYGDWLGKRTSDFDRRLYNDFEDLAGIVYGLRYWLTVFGLYRFSPSHLKGMPHIIEPDSGYRRPAHWLVNLVLIGLMIQFSIPTYYVYRLFHDWHDVLEVGYPVLLVLFVFFILNHSLFFGQSWRRFPEHPIEYTIEVPANIKWNPENTIRFTEHLIQTIPHVSLQIVGEYERIVWKIVDWRNEIDPEIVTDLIYTYYPDAYVAFEAATPPEVEENYYHYTIHFQPAAEFVWPIRQIDAVKEYDPLIPFTQALANLHPGERVTLALTVSVPAHYAYRQGMRMITVSRFNLMHVLSLEGLRYTFSNVMSGNTRDERYPGTEQRIAYDKLNNPLWQCFVMLQIDSPQRERIFVLSNLDAQMWQFGNLPYNAVIWRCRPPYKSISEINSDTVRYRNTTIVDELKNFLNGYDDRWRDTRFVLSPREIVSLWHLPYDQFTASKIKWSKNHRGSVPAGLEQMYGVGIGVHLRTGQSTIVRLPEGDRDLHTYIVGKTGVGKSTLMHTMIHQDIQAGKGVGVIDPHGDLVRQILRESIPLEREDNVVLVDFNQRDFPPPLNPFAVPEGVPREAALSHVMSLLKKIYGDDWSRTRMESALYSALAVLLYEDQPTPRDISRLFLDPAYRTQLLQRVQDPVALEYWWDEYGVLSDGMRQQIREPVLNRIRIFYRNATVRNMVCHPYQLDFRKIIDEGKIFLANLNSDYVQSEQANLGAMLMTQFQMAAMARRAIVDGEYQPFYLYIDEVHHFVTTSLPTILSEARKYGLSLTAANQFLGQLQGETLDAFLGNVGALIAFACSPDDARKLAPLVKPALSAEYLADLDRFNAAVKMHLNGQSLSAFSMTTPPPLPATKKATKREARIIDRSIANYTPWTRQEVEAWYNERYQRRQDPRPTGHVSDYD